MDVSAFSDKDFNAIEWINKTFRAIDQKDKEAHISSMVTKLQLYVQQANNALEETSQQVLQNMPEVMHDMAAIQKEALSLKDKMYFVKEEIAKIDKGSESSLADLARLDNIKIELQKAKQAIQEADKWTLLANEIEDVFESHKIDEIAAKIISMQQSLVVLENSNDSEDKKMQLEGFKNRLEAIVSPHLLKAFTSNNIEESKRFVKIFKSMDRLNQMIKYYCKCHKGFLCQQWSSTIELDQDQTISQWLKTYYDFLLSNWQTQVKWCSLVFKTCDMIPGIYCEVLEAIDTNIGLYIDSALKQQHDHLPYLISLKEISKNFSVNLRAALQQQGLYTNSTWCDLYCAIVSPYSSYITKYCQLEERHLLGQLSSPQPSDLMDTVQVLAHRNTEVSGFCLKAIQRCVSFTESLAFSGLIQALQYCLKKFLEEYRSALRQVDVEKVSTEEWTMFKICLTLLQRIGELLLEVKQLDQELIQTIIFQSNSDKELLEIRTTLLKKTTISDYYSLVKNVKEGTVVSVLGDEVLGRLEKLCIKVYQSCVGVMSSRVAGHLADSRVWWEGHTNQLQPDYSYVPLEYITQIGEYLMTLPQHLEPFVLREDGSLSAALGCVRQPGDTSPPADYILGNIARLTCSHYTEIILSLSHLSEHSAKQLAVDIGYLGNVLEDLGHSLSDNMTQINQLLRIPAESYVNEAQNLGCSPKLVASIRQLRNITSS